MWVCLNQNLHSLLPIISKLRSRKCRHPERHKVCPSPVPSWPGQSPHPSRSVLVGHFAPPASVRIVLLEPMFSRNQTWPKCRPEDPEMPQLKQPNLRIRRSALQHLGIMLPRIRYFLSSSLMLLFKTFPSLVLLFIFPPTKALNRWQC